MNRSRRVFWYLFAVVAVLYGSALGWQKVQAEQRINELMRPASEVDEVGYGATEPIYKEASWRLYKLWRQRHKRDVCAQITSFLQNDDGPLRENAARILGRLENPTAIPALKMERQRDESVVSQMALARIESRGLRGEAKLEAIANSVGLKWNDIGELSQRVKSSQWLSSGTQGEKVVKEMVDVLYAQAKSGEDITPFARTLTLFPPQEVLLQGASLPPLQEANLIVEHLGRIQSVTNDEQTLAEWYLVDLSPEATSAILQRFAAMQQRPDSFAGQGYSEIFRAAALIGDRRTIAPLRSFAEKAPQPTKDYASRSLQQFGIGDKPKQRSLAWAPWSPLSRR